MAQEGEQTDSQQRLDDFTAVKKHELSIDVTAGLAISAINPRYEYLLGRYSGVGADIFIAIDNDNIDLSEYETFSFNPYYRQYFFSKEDFGAKGFYGEGFLKFYTFELDGYYYNNNTSNSVYSNESFFETAIGVAIGWKWVSNSGFMIDTGFGLGRDLGFADDDDFYDAADIRLRGGVNFGWRF
jgi:hypothetical protein